MLTYNANYANCSWVNLISQSHIDFTVPSSMEGQHPKIELSISDNKLIQQTNTQGDIIVKDGVARYKIYEKINANEHFFTYLAHTAGLPTPNQVLVGQGDDFALFSERFNSNREEIIPISSFLQLHNHMQFPLKDFTYKVETLPNSIKIKTDIAKQIYFNLLIGNLDTHSQNFSLLKDEEDNYSISPMYDICHTESLIKHFAKTNAVKHLITINNKNKNIQITDLLADLNLPPKEEEKLLKDFSKITQATKKNLKEINESYIQKELQKIFKENIDHQINIYENEIKSQLQSPADQTQEILNKHQPNQDSNYTVI